MPTPKAPNDFGRLSDFLQISRITFTLCLPDSDQEGIATSKLDFIGYIGIHVFAKGDCSQMLIPGWWLIFIDNARCFGTCVDVHPRRECFIVPIFLRQKHECSIMPRLRYWAADGMYSVFDITITIVKVASIKGNIMCYVI